MALKEIFSLLAFATTIGGLASNPIQGIVGPQRRVEEGAQRSDTVGEVPPGLEFVKIDG